VKCTGERNGCERCQTLQLSCVYLESRIGKVVGSRARQRSVQQQSSGNQYPPDNNRGVDTSRSRATETRAIPTSTSTNTSTFMGHSNGQWMAASSTSSSGIDSSLGTARDLNQGAQEQSGTDLFLAPIDFDIEDMLNCSSGSAEFGYYSSPQAESTEDEAKRLAELDSQCVLLCCQVATELEGCKVANVKSLQIVLEIVKKAVERLADLVRLQQESRNFKCMAMFGVLAYQIIELLEGGCASFLDESPAQSSFASQVHGMLPGLSFGYLTMGPKEQSSWRCHIVLREIRQTSELLQKIKKLSAVGERAQSDRERCFDDLENRLKALSDKVTSHE
jgi:hypothetical protein